MKNLFIYLFIYLFTLKADAQVNLVPNPSFEDTINCPNGGGQINKCMFWYNPNTASPDYFNSCANPLTTGVGVPLNAFGYQYARTGNAYAGIYALNSPNINGREYIQVQLTDSLRKDSLYCISFFTCLDNLSNTAITELGLYLSNNSLTSSTFFLFPVVPQITSPASVYLNDTINWVQISNYYVAQGGEQFITIGHFKDDFTMDTISWNLNDPNCFPFCFPASYYYIDDVSIIKCDTITSSSSASTIVVPNIFTPNNDNANDFFKIITSNIQSLNCKIYNRWGILVDELKEVNDAWDGRTTSGVECANGVYFYVLSAKGKEGKEYDKTGFIQLLR